MLIVQSIVVNIALIFNVCKWQRGLSNDLADTHRLQMKIKYQSLQPNNYQNTLPTKRDVLIAALILMVTDFQNKCGKLLQDIPSE